MQAPADPPELDDRRVERETKNLRIEYGRTGDSECRIVSRRTKAVCSSVQTWLEMRQKSAHSGLPHCEVYSKTSKELPQQIMETWQGSMKLDQYLGERPTLLPELAAVYLTLQAATVINYLTQIGADISNWSEEDFVVDERLKDLPKLIYIGWQPNDKASSRSGIQDGLQFVARVLYQCLSGSLPPSDQVPESLAEESPLELGFDNLLMNWVTEDRDLGALGSYALQALHGAETNDGIMDFIRTVYPHLQQASHLAVNEASQQLASERRLLQSVEKHRSRLKELRTRHQFLSGWLIDHQPKLDEGSKVLEDNKAYVQDFERYAQTVGDSIKHGIQREASELDATSDPTAPHASTRTTSPLRFTALADDLEDKFEFKTPGTPKASPIAQPSSSLSVPINPSPTAKENLATAAVESSSAVKIFVLVVLGATLLGVLFAWSLLSTASHPQSSNDSVFYQKETK
jgi:hypothetical protein